MEKTHSIYILAFLWTLWCCLHSLLISRSVIGRMKGLLGAKYAYYRLSYNVFSLLALLPVVLYQLQLQENVVFSWPWPWNLVKIAMYLAAFALFYGGYRAYDIQYVLGIKQLQDMRQGNIQKTTAFRTSGILGYVRHPWYSAAILLVWAFGALTDVSLVSKTILTVYILIGTQLEERKLVCEIGESYVEYRRQVPMLVPWKKSKKNIKESAGS